MRVIWSTLIKGLVAILPIGLTIYLVYWLAVSVESLLGQLIKSFVPADYYWPGMGLLVGLILLFLTGLAVNAWIVRRLLNFGEKLLEHIPLVKTIYGAIRDFTAYFSPTQKKQDLKKVVLISLGESRLIGFLTREHVSELVSSTGEDTVAVYLPMSYQMGGYTLYLPRANIEPIDLSVEHAMRMALTAGLSRTAS